MCFLGDVRVICCNSLSDSHFQTNVIDDVENLFDCYLHIIFSVLSTLTSCTHYMQIYAKLNKYDCVLSNMASEITHCVMFNTFSLGWVEFKEKISKNLSGICF